MSPSPQRPPAQMHVDISLATTVACSCGGTIFQPAMELKSLSALISPTGQQLNFSKPVIICIQCRKPYEQETEETNEPKTSLSIA